VVSSQSNLLLYIFDLKLYKIKVRPPLVHGCIGGMWVLKRLEYLDP